MIHCEKKIPSFFELSGKDKICLLWYRFFINNKLKWKISSAIFKLKCRMLGVQCGEVRCYGRVDLYRAPESSIAISDNVSISSSSSRGNACSLYARARLRTLTPSASIQIGQNTGMNGVSITARTKSILIGNHCRIGPNVIIVDTDCHAIMPEDRKGNPGFDSDRDVHIGENVWIGMNAIILKGVTIGRNSVIGAGSVVTKDIGENCLAAGTPAKEIRNLAEQSCPAIQQ